MTCQSMTGFGQGVYRDETFSVKVEIRSVNHRFSECVVRLPRDLLSLEGLVRRAVLQRVGRGHLDVHVSLEWFDQPKSICVDWKLFEQFLEIEREAIRRSGFLHAIDTSQGHVADLQAARGVARWLQHPGVIRLESSQVPQSLLSEKILQAVEVALNGLCETRQHEGHRLANDLNQKVQELRTMVASMTTLEKSLVRVRRAELQKRIASLGVTVDLTRMEAEIALLADKASIDEELVRLQSHVDAFLLAQSGIGPVGRRLEFIVQEMHREVNTIGAKSTDMPLTHIVVDAKVVVEQLREQVQNIE